MSREVGDGDRRAWQEAVIYLQVRDPAMKPRFINAFNSLAKACGGTDETAARALGWASGLANYLRAVPELEARGRQPLRTVSIISATFSGSASGVMPCPRLKICGPLRKACTTARVASTRAGPPLTM